MFIYICICACRGEKEKADSITAEMVSLNKLYREAGSLHTRVQAWAKENNREKPGGGALNVSPSPPAKNKYWLEIRLLPPQQLNAPLLRGCFYRIVAAGGWERGDSGNKNR